MVPDWNRVACGSSPCGGGIFPFTYLVVLLGVGYLKAVSTSCCRLPAPQKPPALMSSVHYSFCSTNNNKS